MPTAMMSDSKERNKRPCEIMDRTWLRVGEPGLQVQPQIRCVLGKVLSLEPPWAFSFSVVKGCDGADCLWGPF